MKTANTALHKLKLIEVALLIGLAAFLVSGGLALRTQAQLADRVVRLHVLANSDGEEDQALKLLVVMRNGVEFSPKQFTMILKNRLENHKIPIKYEQVESIARTYNGKLDRKAYQQL